MKNKGFTFMELVVILSVLFILLLFAFVGYKDYKNSSELLLMSTDIQSLLVNLDIDIKVNSESDILIDDVNLSDIDDNFKIVYNNDYIYKSDIKDNFSIKKIKNNYVETTLKKKTEGEYFLLNEKDIIYVYNPRGESYE